MYESCGNLRSFVKSAKTFKDVIELWKLGTNKIFDREKQKVQLGVNDFEYKKHALK